MKISRYFKSKYLQIILKIPLGTGFAWPDTSSESPIAENIYCRMLN